jgi:carbon monoxide dehydrogenase subunit G
MLLNLSEDLHLDASAAEVWKLLRDTPRLAGLLPGVASVKSLHDPSAEAYAATVHDKIGPFKVTLNLELRIIETTEQVLLKAALKGADSHNLNRVLGTLQVGLHSVETRAGTQMRFEASVEILGKLATLGAIPMKRRTTQLFREFAGNIQGQFVTEKS